MKFYTFLIFLIIFTKGNYSQDDSSSSIPLNKETHKTTINPRDTTIEFIIQHPEYIDSLKLKIKLIVFSGNEITKDYILLREMALKEGDYLTIKKLQQSILNIYNLKLFTRVDILPIPTSSKEVILNVDVQERWYIFPLPQAGMDDGEWSKKWIGLNLLWDNVRGRNERLALQFRVLYNPSVSGSYSVPWIGDKLHLLSSIGAGYSDLKNQSLQAVGRNNGNQTLQTTDSNFENISFYSQFSIGKYLNKNFSLYTNFSYNYVRVSEYGIGRTVSPSGKDKYLGLGLGLSFDTRDLLEYSTKGYYLNSSYTRYGYVNDEINYGKFDIESQSYLPISFSNKYYITIASRLFTSLSVGTTIPYYNHVYLGYGDDYVRGWLKKGFEGNDKLTLYNEIRIPLLIPRYINAGEVPLLKSVPYINKFELRHGLYLTLLYDIGAVWNNNDRLQRIGFMSGAGLGLNAVLPFGYVVRLEWAFPITKPSVGQVVFTLNAKF